MSLTRYPDWSSRLERFLISVTHRDFRWGMWDCCLFPADAIAVMTGVDIAAPLRGQYSTRRTSLAAVRTYTRNPSATIADVAAFICSSHSAPEIPPRTASRGDLVAIPRPLGYSLGLVSLNGMNLLVVGQLGTTNRDVVGHLPFSSAARAWRIG